MKKLHIVKYWYTLLLVPIIIITLDTLDMAKTDTAPYQFKQSIMDDVARYVKDHPNDGDDYRQSYFFHLNSNASLSIFHNSIRNSTPMNYDVYLARNHREETTSESLVFILPCTKEEFSFFSEILHCSEKKIVFQISKNDSKKLYEIITRLKSKIN